MHTITHDCPRCGAKQMTFDVKGDQQQISKSYDRRSRPAVFEIFSICRRCKQGTIFVITSHLDLFQRQTEHKSLLNNYKPTSLETDWRVKAFINVANFNKKDSPEHLEGPLADAFDEAIKCLAVGCYNASGTMFRLCLDLATKPMMPDEKKFKSMPLGPRLDWLFKNGRLPSEMEELAVSVKEDGNDGAHQGNLEEEDAEDIYDFTFAVLNRLVSEPTNVQLAKERRTKRRNPSA